MAVTIELVRFDVAPERRAELIDGHAEARRAIHAVAPPGAIWSRLLRLGKRGWLEVVAWPERAVFDTALERAPSDPTARAWFGLADPAWSISMGEVADPPEAPPPREGELELTWLRGGQREMAAAHRLEDGWSALIEVEGRAWIYPSGWSEREPSLLVLAVPPGGGGAGIRGGAAGAASRGAGHEGEVARIANAIDSAEDPDAAR